MVFIVAGTYDRGLFGATLDEESASMETVFAYAPHSAALRTVASSRSGGFLVSGSNDESLRVYGLPEKRELGVLLQQVGGIYTAAFFGDQHLLTGAGDGTVAVWRCRDWECLTVMKGHGSPVVSIDVHPTGKLAISVGRDGGLRLWDLVKGRCVWRGKVRETEIEAKYDEPTAVAWAGKYFVVAIGPVVIVRDSSNNEIVSRLKHPKRVGGLCVLDDGRLATGCGDGIVRLYDVDAAKCVAELAGAHDTRVRNVLPIDGGRLLVSASSDGRIVVWDVAKGEELCRMESAGRITCLAVSAASPEGEGEGEAAAAAAAAADDAETTPKKKSASSKKKARKKASAKKKKQAAAAADEADAGEGTTPKRARFA